MKLLLPYAAFAILLLLGAGPGLTGEPTARERAEVQAELDRKCEAARQTALEPIRREIYDECVNKQRKAEDFCRRYADGYEGTRPGGALRFYELPECQAAFDYKRSHRSENP